MRNKVIFSVVNYGDGIGDFIHAYNFWKWFVSNKKFTGLIPYMLVKNSNEKQDVINNILGKIDTLPLKENISYNSEELVRFIRRLQNDICCVIFVSVEQKEDSHIGHLFPDLNILFIREINRCKTTFGSDIPNYFCMGGFSKENSVGLPLILNDPVNFETKIDIVRRLCRNNPSFQKIFGSVSSFDCDNDNSIANFLKTTCIVHGYFQGAKFCNKTYLDIIIRSPVMKNKNIIFITNKGIGSLEQKTWQEVNNVRDETLEDKLDELDRLYRDDEITSDEYIKRKKAMMGLDKITSIPLKDIPSNVFINPMFLSESEYDDIMKLSRYFKIASGDNTIIESFNHRLFPLILDRNEKYIYDIAEKINPQRYPLFTNWYETYFFYELDILNTKLADDCFNFENGNNVKDISSHFTEEFFEEWNEIVEFINREYNTFDFLEKRILDSCKLGSSETMIKWKFRNLKKKKKSKSSHTKNEKKSISKYRKNRSKSKYRINPKIRYDIRYKSRK